MAEREVVFDENGNTVETVEAPQALETQDTPEDAQDGADTPAPEGKFRIGDQTFQTEAEALAFAQAQVAALEAEKQVSDAYQQGLRDAALKAAPQTQNVTPPPPAIDTEKFYTNPQEFLTEFAQKVKNETLQTVEQTAAERNADEQVWRDFTHAHPMFADFRNEVEFFTRQHAKTVQGIAATKGQKAAFDYVATQMKVQFNKYAEATKPVRELPNTRAAGPTGAKGGNVTPPATKEKPMNFMEQVRSIRKSRK